MPYRKGREVQDEREHDRRSEDDQDSLDFKGFGVSVRTKGREVAIVALFIAVVTLIALAGYAHHTEMVKNDSMISEQVSEMVYVLSLSPEKREALNLSMPRSLRLKTRDRSSPSP